jgi:hypothetical protein
MKPGPAISGAEQVIEFRRRDDLIATSRGDFPSTLPSGMRSWW